MSPIAHGPTERIIYDLIPCHQASDRGGKEWIGLKTRDMTYSKGIGDSAGILFNDSDDPFQMNNLWNDEKYRKEKEQLSVRLDEILAECNYSFRPWQQTLIEDAYLEKWNESQSHLGREILNAQSEKFSMCQSFC